LTAARYQSRREMDLKAALLKETELLEDEKNEIKKQVDNNISLYNTLTLERKETKSQKHYLMMKNIVEDIIKMSDK
jgi:hypothetical protein